MSEGLKLLFLLHILGDASSGSLTKSSPALSWDISLHMGSVLEACLLGREAEAMLCRVGVCYASARASPGSADHPCSSIRGPGSKPCPDATCPSLEVLQPCPGSLPPPFWHL